MLEFFIRCSVVFIVGSNALLGSQWISTHHDIALQYDETTWKIVASQDTKVDTFISFFDKSDGSSTLIRVEYLENALEINDSLIVTAMGESLFSSDPSLRRMKQSTLMLNQDPFLATDYIFMNKKFGKQWVRHLFSKQGSYIFMIMLAWPFDKDFAKENKLPQKHQLFLDNLRFK